MLAGVAALCCLPLLASALPVSSQVAATGGSRSASGLAASAASTGITSGR